MPEMLTPTSAIVGAGLGSEIAVITDGRFSEGPVLSSSPIVKPGKEDDCLENEDGDLVR